MTSDIDDLLEDLRKREAEYRDEARNHQVSVGRLHTHCPEAEALARHIAAVEELRERAALVVGPQASATASETGWVGVPKP